MARVNDNYLKLKSSYLFADIAQRVKVFQAANPGAKLIRLGIGDVTQPLPPTVVTALHAAVDEMTKRESFRGYGPDAGYDFLLELIAEHDYGARGVKMGTDEIFVSDGGKQDSGNIQEIFAPDAVVALMDPVYPVYVDSNVMAGRSGENDGKGRYAGFVYLPCTAENGFRPALPDRHVDLIYLCYPNNPTGAVLRPDALKTWVDYARREQAVILYDAAYASYIREPDVPQSIFEIEGARECAIEFRSYSKTAGFTGVRCAYTVVPKELQGRGPQGEPVSLEVQRHPVHHPARRRRDLHAGGEGAGQSVDRLLHGERADHPRGHGSDRPHRLRRAQRALHLGEDASRPGLVGLLRQAAERGARRQHARRRLRPGRRRLSPPHGIRST
jgi:LL-diaminopimelate aminotransferase